MHVKLAENICHHGKRGEGRDKINAQEWVEIPLIPPNTPFPQKQGIFIIKIYIVKTSSKLS